METPRARTALSGPRQVEWDVADRHEPADAPGLWRLAGLFPVSWVIFQQGRRSLYLYSVLLAS